MRNLKNTVLRCLISSLVAMLPVTGAALAKTCEETLPMTAGETWRASAGAGSDVCFEIDVATSGLLLVELITPETTPSPPRLLERPGASAGAHLVKSSATSFLVWFEEAGTYRMDVAAGDRAFALPAYNLRTAFLAREQGFREAPGDPSEPFVTCTSTWSLKEDPGEIENPPEATYKEDPGEIENPPEVNVTCTSVWSFKEDPGEIENPPELQATYKEDPGEIENPPESTYKEDPGEIENPPESTFTVGERGRPWDVYDLALFSREMRSALADLCAGGEVDDHGDGFLCATALVPGRVSGEIGNPWNDDADVFRFDLAGVRTVEISTDGSTDTAGELYDRFGNRLDRATDGGADGNFRMVRTLSPGAYFVRVAGERFASGPYELTVRTSLR